MIQRLYRLLLLFCSIAVFAACSDSDGNDNNGGNGGEQIPDGGDTYGYVTDANGKTVALTDLGSGKYTFKMPSAKVSVGFKTTADFLLDTSFTYELGLISRLLGEVRRQFTLEGHNAELWDETARRFEQVDPLPLELLPADSMLCEFYGSRT